MSICRCRQCNKSYKDTDIYIQGFVKHWGCCSTECFNQRHNKQQFEIEYKSILRYCGDKYKIKRVLEANKQELWRDWVKEYHEKD